MDVNLEKRYILYYQPLVLCTEEITAGAIKVKTPPLLHKCSVVIKIIILLIIALFSSVAQSYLTLCDPLDCSMPGLSVHHQLPEFTLAHVH